MTVQWKAGDRAMVVVKSVHADGRDVMISRAGGGGDALWVDALHPLPPTMSAEDAAATCENALIWATVTSLVYAAPEMRGHWHDELTRQVNERNAAVRSRAVKQEADVQQFKVGDRVRTPDGDCGEIWTFAPDFQACTVLTTDSRTVRCNVRDLSRADGDDREAEVVDRADEEGRRVAGLRDAVVTEFMKLLTPEGYLAIGSSDYGQAYPAVKALVDLRAALAPPEPVDAVAELREAAAKSVRILERAELNLRSVSQDNGAGTAVCEALSELREALARAP